MDLVPCVHCKRHVGVTETACPFCATSLPPQRSQFAFAARLTRAAIFSAAAVTAGACKDSSKSSAALQPTAGSAAPGSAAGSGSADDLEKMLDADGRTVDHPAPVAADAGADGDAAVAAATDAGVPGDAGIDEAKRKEIIREKRVDRDLQDKDEDVRRRHQRELERQKIKIQVNNKPYGAPPARRRVV